MASNQPIINLSIGSDLMNILQPKVADSAVAAPTVPPTIPTPTAIPAFDIHCPTLLHPSRRPGPDMPLEAFCKQFGLEDDVLNKFHTHKFSYARTLRFVTIGELKDMSFKLGEIAALRDAVESWSLL